MSGVRIIPIITARVTKKLRNVKKHERNSLVFSRSFSKRYSLKVGIKATAVDPSAKSRRNRFGIKKATEKASERALVPRSLALVISRRSPKTRDAKVRSDRVVPWDTKERPVSESGFGRISGETSAAIRLSPTGKPYPGVYW
jgi:hypothetical protein